MTNPRVPLKPLGEEAQKSVGDTPEDVGRLEWRELEAASLEKDGEAAWACVEQLREARMVSQESLTAEIRV